MKIGKICVLIDPDKSEAKNVVGACVKLQGHFGKRFLRRVTEYWVGGTKSSADGTRKWLEILKNEKIGPRVIFPGKISQGILGYQYADLTLIPYLLNWSSKKVFIYNLIGIALSKLYKKRQEFGYFILSNNSSAGKKVGARKLSNKKILQIINKFLNTYANKIVYLEYGSGSKESLDMKLIKSLSDIVHKHLNGMLIVGGGITTTNEVKKLFQIGVDKVVIGTAFERSSIDKSLAVMKNIIKPFAENNSLNT